MIARPPASVPLRFRIGTRTLGSVRRRLQRVPLSLADALADALAGDGALPPLPTDADGQSITSLPVGRLTGLMRHDRIVAVRQLYVRSWIDLTLEHDRWWHGLSARARSDLGRKRRRLGADAEVRRYASADEIAAFLPLAGEVARASYQARLPDAALPSSTSFRQHTLTLGAADGVRAWLLFVCGTPAAYLFCAAEEGRGDTLRYEHVGHDPAFAALSPGTLLLLAALRDLMNERRFARFDFLEGDGRHKRLFASHGVDCCDVLLLRWTLANRLLAAALTGFDAAVARAGGSKRLRRWTRAFRR